MIKLIDSDDALFLEMSVVFAFFTHKPRATFFIVGLNLTIAALMCNLFLTVGQGVVKKFTL